MINKHLLISLAAVATTGTAWAKAPTPHQWPELGVESSIAFPDYGAIRNYEADGEDGIWIEDRQRRWYYGDFIGSCRGLDFSQAIGFDTGGLSRFDRFSKIVTREDRCQLISFVTSNKPLSRKERKRLAKEAAAKVKAEAAN
jgi:Family of unknown function (DUF6491)